ncbi:MAG: type IV pilus assembly protein PilM [Fimbriimonadaceae bacterium]|nr:type IV pilus assembly protein PilM [Fimbriimonadaceae bacterium]
MAVLGIDIGSDTIKIAEMARARGGYKLLGLAVTPTPEGAVSDGDVRDPDAVAAAIRETVRTHKLKAKKAICAVQGTKSTVVRIVEHPRLTAKELAAEVEGIIERNTPFAIRDTIYDYAVVERPDLGLDSPNMDVLFGAVLHETVSDLAQAMVRARLKPVAVDVQPLALARSVACQDERRQRGTVAVVNIGATATELCIVRDGQLHFPRTITPGGRTITQRISEGLGVSEKEAERLKREVASVKPLPPGTVVAPAAAVEDEKPAADTDFGFGAAAFSTDAGEESDTGFGGSGAGFGGFAFEDTATVEVHTDDDDDDKPRLELEDDGDEPPTFKFSLAAADDEKDPPVPAEQPFSFGFDEDEPPAKPAAEQPPAAAAPGEETADGDPAFSFGFAEAEEPAEEAADDAGFDFSLGDDDATATSTAGAASDHGGATDVGSSFDLGDLGTSDEGLDFDLGELGEATQEGTGGFSFTDLGLTSEVAAVQVDAEADEAQQVRQVVEPVVRDIAGEIARSLEYYSSRYDGAMIDAVVIVGGTARLEGLAEFLEQELGRDIEVELGDPLKHLVVSNSRLTDERLRAAAPVMAVAVGLAMWEK